MEFVSTVLYDVDSAVVVGVVVSSVGRNVVGVSVLPNILI